MKDTHDDTDSPTSALPALRRGELFADRYEVQDVLGAGGMGAVYRVLDRTLGEVVALKVLTLPTEQAVDRFRREVKVARKVTHRNVCRTYDLGAHRGVHYLTMEHVEGRALDALLEEVRRLDVPRTVEIASQVCDGLAAAHAAGIVHRDLKPANVLLEKSGRVVLTDFGIARPILPEGAAAQTVGVVGTPSYMAPEQVHGDSVGAHSDLYALGVMLYEMLTGTLPFEGPTPLAAAVARVLQDPPDPRARGVPEPMATLILHCMSRDPAGRPASAEEVREALESARASGSADVVHAASRSGRLSTSTPRAPTSPGNRALAVLPFRYRGPAEQEYLGQGLTDELIDTLSRTRGIRVLGSGATSRIRDDRDATSVGQTLGVDAIVDGTVQLAGDRIRIAARLVEVSTGLQVWTEKFEGRFEDVFGLEERVGRKIAEALRLNLEISDHPEEVAPEGVELYFLGRRAMRRFRLGGPDGALGLLERCLQIAPGFRPAIAAYAVTCIRAWFVPGIDPTRDFAADAKRAVARAQAEAGELAETHLAAAQLAVQEGDYAASVGSLRRALEIAPTFADAHEYLGNLQLEADRIEEGTRRLRLAHDLEPALPMALLMIARAQALSGRMDEYERTLTEARASADPNFAGMLQLEMRVGAWRNEPDRIRRQIPQLSTDGFSAQLDVFGRYLLGDLTPAEFEEAAGAFASFIANPRFFTIVQQQIAEAHFARGAHDLGLDHLLAAVDSVLVDLAWLDRCPLLEPLRGTHTFAECRRKVLARAETIWRV